MVTILHADNDIAVCIKPAGVLSQDAGETSMPAQLRRQLQTDSVHVVHRLDREVGGVMVFALNQTAAAVLSRSVQDRTLEKTYRAVLHGVPGQQEAVLEDLLFHDKNRNKTYIVDRIRKGVKDARLDYRLLQTSDSHALVEIHLHTGRTHQIRVQFASRKLPLVGDRKYGGKDPGKPLCLWSYQLSFPHPATGAAMTFTQPAPWEQEWINWFT